MFSDMYTEIFGPICNTQVVICGNSRGIERDFSSMRYIECFESKIVFDTRHIISNLDMYSDIALYIIFRYDVHY